MQVQVHINTSILLYIFFNHVYFLDDNIDGNLIGCDSYYHQLMVRHELRRSIMHDMPNLQESSLNVTFYLLTGSDQTGSTVLTTGDIRSLRDSSFNSSNPTRIIVHGFCNCHLSQFCEATRQKLVKQPQQYNVITMSWPSGKWLLDYWTARWRIDPASQILADFIDFLHTAGGMDLQDLYLVGHSLGAHLSGLAGKKVTSGKVGTIVALDPAKPAFDINKPDERLAITDANYVEVIHTNGKRLGMYEPIGHTDFYPNGGVQQPGCSMWWFGGKYSKLVHRVDKVVQLSPYPFSSILRTWTRLGALRGVHRVQAGVLVNVVFQLGYGQ